MLLYYKASGMGGGHLSMQVACSIYLGKNENDDNDNGVVPRGFLAMIS